MNKKIHFVGIGGIGLSGLAQIMSEKGYEVKGSDIEDSFIIDKLRKKFGPDSIKIGHKEEFLDSDTGKVIYSSAIPENNPEIKKAKKLGITAITYAEAIKEFTHNSYTVAVCGTHGKTTVTAFSSLALLAGEKDPTVIIGSELKEFDGNNYRSGDGKYFIVEACEYKRNFLNYHPNIIILTNLEAEHLDYFKDLEDYKNAFKEFITMLPEDGYLITNADDKNVMDIVKDFHGNLILFSEKDKNCDWYIDNSSVYKGNELVAQFNLKIPGSFNKLNAVCGLILGQILNIDRQAILDKFSNFTGAWRRFEIIGKYFNFTVISDYAHHPTAIEKTIFAAHEKYPDAKICCLFQPHQYNRTKNFLNEFGKAFKEAELVILPNIYKVRDTAADIESVNVDNLLESIINNGTNAIKISDYQSIKNYLTDNKENFDLLLIMGAGDIWKFAEFLFQGEQTKCINCED